MPPDRAERRSLAACGGAVALLHVFGIGLLATFGLRNPAFWGLGALAYTFGLRHAFDADHISAIDNVVRKLLGQGRRPVTAGFWFSLGHSTIVFVISLLVALTMRTVVRGVTGPSGVLHQLGGIIGTGVSGLFLLFVGAFNLFILFDLVGVARRTWRGESAPPGTETEVRGGGVFTRLFGRLFRLVGAGWQMYPIGVLFGLGFDTATEVALLGISAGSAAKGAPFFTVLAFPLLFAAGMALMDTVDGAFMVRAYAWAFSSPIRKVFYNLSVTSLSVFVALFIGVLELARILAQIAGIEGPFWTGLQNLDFATFGVIIVIAFGVTWAGSFATFRLGRFDSRAGQGVRRAAR